MATGSNGDDGAYGQPSFETDDGVGNRHAPLSIPESSVPPLPAFFKLFGSSDAEYYNRISGSIVNATKQAQRPLTQQEAEHLAGAFAQAYLFNAWDTPATLAVTVALALRGRAAMRLPLNLFPNKNPYVFGFGRLKITGSPAYRCWNATRFFAYYFMCNIFVEPIIHVAGASSTANSITRDPVLKQWVIDVRKATEARHHARREAGAQPMGSRPGPSSTPYPRGPPPSSQSQQEEQYSQPFPQSAPSPSSWQPQEQYRDQDQPSSANDDPFYESEPAQSSSPPPSSPPPSASGSAWDRLRQQAATQQPAPAQSTSTPTSSWAERRQRATQGTTDSYSYSSDDHQDQAQRARDQAQREFDEMLERERQNAERSG